MRPVSDAFLRAVTSSHTMTARARVVAPGQQGTDPDGVELPIIGGDVELDASAKIRGTLELETSAAWPTRSDTSLAPFGSELFVERGLTYGNGVTEWVSLGFFRLGDTEEPARGSLRLAASDRMAGLEDARLLAPRQFDSSRTYGSVVAELVADVYPAATVEWDDQLEEQQLGRSLIAEQDRREFLADLVTAAGKVWYWDYRGVLVIRNAPDPADPVATVRGGRGGVLLELERGLSRKGTYNAVVATGEGTDLEPPARAVVVDDNPESPTYFSGPFGPVPRFYSSPMLTTDEQAENAARNMLGRSLGLPYAVDFSAVPNPALEPLDPVAVSRPGMENETHVLMSLTIPLTPEDPLEAQTREQTITRLAVL